MGNLVFDLQTNSFVPCLNVRYGSRLCENGNPFEQGLFESGCAIEVMSVFG
jgi:hypothetical protein